MLADNEQPSENTIGKVDADLHVEVQVYSWHRARPPGRPGGGCVHAAMMANTTLGGLAFDVTEDGTSWDFDEADGTALIVRMRYIVRYRHTETA